MSKNRDDNISNEWTSFVEHHLTPQIVLLKQYGDKRASWLPNNFMTNAECAAQLDIKKLEGKITYYETKPFLMRWLMRLFTPIEKERSLLYFYHTQKLLENLQTKENFPSSKEWIKITTRLSHYAQTISPFSKLAYFFKKTGEWRQLNKHLQKTVRETENFSPAIPAVLSDNLLAKTNLYLSITATNSAMIGSTYQHNQAPFKISDDLLIAQENQHNNLLRNIEICHKMKHGNAQQQETIKKEIENLTDRIANLFQAIHSLDKEKGVESQQEAAGRTRCKI